MTRTVLTLILILAAFPVAADVLLIEEVRQAERLDLPTNGMRTGQVESRFGSPGQKFSPVGDPPITRWEYERWSVYFEHDRVLFTVLHPGAVIDRQARDS